MFDKILKAVLTKNILPDNEELFPCCQELCYTTANRQADYSRFWKSKKFSKKTPKILVIIFWNFTMF